MPKTNSRKTQHAQFKKNVQKLQKAGLLGPVDFRKSASKIAAARRIEKYRSIISGKASAVKAPDLATAKRLRNTLGLKGAGLTVVVPREKGETYSIPKKSGELVSTRKGYGEGETIKKTVSRNFPAPPPSGSGKRLYYTIPERTRGAGRLKRKTFGTFDEMLYYISKYDVRFEDIEDRIEIEEVTKNARKDKRLQKTITEERAAALARYKRKAAKKKSAAKKKKSAVAKRYR